MSFKKNYNIIERLLHHVAFSFPFVQRILRELESDLYASKLKNINSQHEVFVTGLPRAGTTLLLEMLYKTGEFNTFTYRHMPFILSPVLWGKFSKPFYKNRVEQERAHGDGMKVSFDSPEAFEEIIWLSLLKKSILKENWIETLNKQDNSPELSDLLRSTFRKILYTDEDGKTRQHPRYLSKNNANISRLELVRDIFPGSCILVPFRNPSTHVSSIMRMHRQFLNEHKEDAFSKKYMQWLGHFEFGENFKPFNFNGWLDSILSRNVQDENFFIQYWIEAYSFVLKSEVDNIVLVDFDKLLVEGAKSLSRIADVLDLKNKDAFINSAISLRAPTTKEVSMEKACHPEVWRRTQQIYSELKRKAV